MCVSYQSLFCINPIKANVNESFDVKYNIKHIENMTIQPYYVSMCYQIVYLSHCFGKYSYNKIICSN